MICVRPFFPPHKQTEIQLFPTFKPCTEQARRLSRASSTFGFDWFCRTAKRCLGNMRRFTNVSEKGGKMCQIFWRFIFANSSDIVSYGPGVFCSWRMHFKMERFFQFWTLNKICFFDVLDLLGQSNNIFSQMVVSWWRWIPMVESVKNPSVLWVIWPLPSIKGQLGAPNSVPMVCTVSSRVSGD